VPVGAAVVVPLRHSLAWLGVTLAITLVFWWLPQMGIEIENHVPPEARVVQALIDRVTAILALAAIAASFVLAQRRTERDLEASNATLVRETDHVSLLRHAAVAANRASSLEEALRAGVSGICMTMGWPLGHAFRLDDNGVLVSSGVFHVEDPEHYDALRKATSGMRVRGDERLVGRALARRTPQSIHDFSSRPGPRTALARAFGIHTHLAVPVLAGGEVCAVLEFGVRRPIEREGRLLEVLADVGLQLGRVAERADLEEQVRQAQKMDAIGQLAAGVAHEVNNPMAYVRANLQTLRSEWDSLREAVDKAEDRGALAERLAEAEELLDESLEGVDRTIAIVRDVNEFSHTGGPLVESVAVDEILESALRVASTHSANGVTVERRFGAPPPVQGSSTQLHQVFVNLIANALQATDGSGHVRVETESAGREVLVRVIDDGPGIPPENTPRLFEPFFTTKAVGEGTGLGLYISYQIVRRHRGEIRVDSTPGAGATFEVRLPLASA
jgi:signal transduction histidine kinase